MRPIDQTSEVPLYYQVREAIRETVIGESWKPGTKLPAEEELAERFGVSRATVRQAILDLVRRGVLYRKQGKGTFVAAPKVEGDFVKVFFPEELSSEHRRISIRRITPPPSVVQMMGISQSEPVIEVVRLRFFNGEPTVLEKSYVREAFSPTLLSDAPTGKLFEYLAQKNAVYIDRAVTHIEPIVIGDYEARLLDVPRGTPALLFTRVSYVGDTPVVLSESAVRGDRCRLLMKSEYPAREGKL